MTDADQLMVNDSRAAIAALMRSDGGRLLASLIAQLRDFQLAEDSLQDAWESAVIHWGRNGVPSHPPAWIMRTARRKAIDRLRRVARFRAKAPQIGLLEEIIRADDTEENTPISDERLRLVFTCCHPALDRQTSVALTLRSVAGLTTEEVARAFVVSTDAMAQRLVRARHKITQAGIAYEVPEPSQFAERLDAVLAVIYLTFNEGYSASNGELVRPLLCAEALRLGQTLLDLLPNEGEVAGLLALMSLHSARQAARLTLSGEMVSLENQDRSLWDAALIAEGLALVRRALSLGQAGPYQLQAAIAAIHVEATTFAATDWAQIVLIYDVLCRIRANPVFELNRIVARSYAEGPDEALALLEHLKQPLGKYQPFHAVRADLLARTGSALAGEAYATAIAMSNSEAERGYLASRAALLD